MKTESIIFSILWVAMSGIPQVSQADERAIMQGVMDVMRTMQQQSGARDNPGGKAMMDIFDDAMGGRDDSRDRRDGRGEQRRRPHGYDDDRPNRRGESQRRGRDYNDDDRPNRRGGARGEQQSSPRYGDSGGRQRSGAAPMNGGRQRSEGSARPGSGRQRGEGAARFGGARQRPNQD